MSHCRGTFARSLKPNGSVSARSASPPTLLTGEAPAQLPDAVTKSKLRPTWETVGTRAFGPSLAFNCKNARNIGVDVNQPRPHFYIACYRKSLRLTAGDSSRVCDAVLSSLRCLIADFRACGGAEMRIVFDILIAWAALSFVLGTLLAWAFFYPERRATAIQDAHDDWLAKHPRVSALLMPRWLQWEESASDDLLDNQVSGLDLRQTKLTS
jgi:hypothetical protein